jgi:predicted DNA-binding transcriptional regulator AlpA
MTVFLSIKDVCRQLNVSRETLRRWEKTGWFPKRVSFTQHHRGRKGYLKSEISGWVEERQASRS